MKKIVYVLLTALISIGLQLEAQVTSSGNFVIGSTFGLSTAKSKITQDSGDGEEEVDNPSSSQFSFSPRVGYFVIDNFAVGIQMDYTSSEVKQPNLDRTTDSDLLFGPFARFYLPVGDDMGLFLEAGFGFGNSNDEKYIGAERQSINTNIFAYGLGPGFTIFSSQAVGVEALLKYNYARSDFDTEIGGIARKTTTRTNQFDFSVGVHFYFTALRPAVTTDKSSPNFR
jgi:hypothetical protein